MRELVEVVSCDLCGARVPSAEMLTVHVFEWNRKRYEIEFDPACEESAESTVTLDILIHKGRPLGGVPGRPRKASSPARPAGKPGAILSEHKFTLKVYDRHLGETVDGERVLRCPLCSGTVRPVTKAGVNNLGAHTRKAHGTTLADWLTEHLGPEALAGMVKAQGAVLTYPEG